MAADQAEQRSRLAGDQTARPGTPESEIEDAIVPSTPPLAGESQGGATMALAIRTPERLQGPQKLIPTLASTATARIKQGTRKRCRVPNKLYMESQYELWSARSDSEV